MTVKELQETLAAADPNAQVLFRRDAEGETHAPIRTVYQARFTGSHMQPFPVVLLDDREAKDLKAKT